MKKIILGMSLLATVSTMAISVDLKNDGHNIGAIANKGEVVDTSVDIRVGAPTRFKKGRGIQYKRLIKTSFEHYQVEGDSFCISYGSSRQLQEGQACFEDFAGDTACVDAEEVTCEQKARELVKVSKGIEIKYLAGSKFKFAKGETETFTLNLKQDALTDGSSDGFSVSLNSDKTAKGDNVKVEEKNGKFVITVSGPTKSRK